MSFLKLKRFDRSSSAAGYLEKMKVLFRDKDPSVRIKTCELLFIVTAHSFGR